MGLGIVSHESFLKIELLEIFCLTMSGSRQVESIFISGFQQIVEQQNDK